MRRKSLGAFDPLTLAEFMNLFLAVRLMIKRLSSSISRRVWTEPHFLFDIMHYQWTEAAKLNVVVCGYSSLGCTNSLYNV